MGKLGLNPNFSYPQCSSLCISTSYFPISQDIGRKRVSHQESQLLSRFPHWLLYTLSTFAIFDLQATKTQPTLAIDHNYPCPGPALDKTVKYSKFHSLSCFFSYLSELFILIFFFFNTHPIYCSLVLCSCPGYSKCFGS